MLKSSIATLHAASSAAAEDFYVRQLGFTLKSAYRADPALVDPCYLGLMRDEVKLHVSSFPGDGVAGGVVMIIVEDLDALHAELIAKGVAIAMPPTDQTWGNREMYVRDPDRNELSLCATAVRPLIARRGPTASSASSRKTASRVS